MKIHLLIVFWGLWFLNFSSRMVLAPLLPIIENELALSHAMSSSIFFFSGAGFTISVFLAGAISKYTGYKKTIFAGYLSLAFFLIGYRFADTYAFFAIMAFLTGLGSGIYMPCALPMITSAFSRDNWGKAIGFHETAASFSLLSIPILATLFLRYFQWKSFFLVLGGACFFVIILFWILAPDPNTKDEKKTGYLAILKKKDFWIISIPWIMMGISTVGIYNIVPLFLVTEKGLQLTSANTILGFSRIGGVIAMVTAGLLINRFGEKRILFFILCVSGISTVGIAIVNEIWLLVILLVLQATISVAFFPTAIIAVSKLTTLEERSTFTGLTMALASITTGIGPVFLGAVADRWNFQAGIIVVGLLTLICCGLIKMIKDVPVPGEPAFIEVLHKIPLSK